MATMCVSLLNPEGQSGRIGRSISRAVKVAVSLGRPSLLMKPPGNLPAAYMPSSMSTVSGKKSTFRSFWDTTAVTSTMVSPDRTNTAPLACFARRPVSKVIFLSPTTTSVLLTESLSYAIPSTFLSRPPGPSRSPS